MDSGDLENRPHGEPEEANGEPEKHAHKRSQKKGVFLCCGVCCCIVLVSIIVLVILIFTVFKARDPTIRVQSIALKGLNVNFGNILTNPSLTVDVDLTTNVSIKNPNYASFSYHNTTAFIFYHDQLIGQTPVAAGHVDARSYTQLTAVTSVELSSTLFSSNLTSDITTGILPLVTTVQVKGTAKVLGTLSVRNVRTNAHCDVLVYIQNQTEVFHCQYKVKI